MTFISDKMTERQIAVENKAITKLWSTGILKKLLEDVKDKDLKTSMAVCLESQRITNDLMVNDRYSPFKRVAIPLMVRAMKASKVFAEKPFVVDRERMDYREIIVSDNLIVAHNKWCTAKVYSDNELKHIENIATKLANLFDILIIAPHGYESKYRQVAFDALVPKQVVVSHHPVFLETEKQALILRYAYV